MRRSALLALALLAAAGAGPAAQSAGIPNDAASIEHALNRLAFGPRPGDVEKVRQMGLAAWIERQLDPAGIDDAAAERRLPPLPEPPREPGSPTEIRRFGRQSVEALGAAKVLRAVYSERQLAEVLTDFWFNHFNVFAGKGRTGLYLAEYERGAIRPHVLGRFRDLLGATAKSPAMLVYLDNWLSVDAEAAERLLAGQQRRAARRGGAVTPSAPPAQARRRGLNENYARELLELHTLGVDGGYTQQDIIEVARAFTGWTLAGPGRGALQAVAGAGGRALPADMLDAAGGFRFQRALHDDRAKIVLGHELQAGGGIEDGERVLDILAAHPSTARHIAGKLARRFVSETPPDSLVARAAARFRDTGGQLRDVVRVIVTSPEFFAADVRRSQIKTPLEFVTSALRATGREPSDARPALRALQQLGMAPYMCQPPTGYDDASDAWVSAGALVARMNIAQQLAGPQAAAIGGPEFQKH
jgi:uncharacterized protein (DUF1800 family)